MLSILLPGLSTPPDHSTACSERISESWSGMGEKRHFLALKLSLQLQGQTQVQAHLPLHKVQLFSITASGCLLACCPLCYSNQEQVLPRDVLRRGEGFCCHVRIFNFPVW